LNEIAQDALVTQSGLSDRLGIAVGSLDVKKVISHMPSKLQRKHWPCRCTRS